MRLRKVKNAYSILCGNKEYFIEEPKANKGKWQGVFNNSNPIHLEIGCGKGKFIIEKAQTFPEMNFIAIEKFDSILIRALRDIQIRSLPNVKLILTDASELESIFEKEELDQIYLNFSDPWPKYAHRKRRLTSERFLEVYRNILKQDGAIIQKTDSRKLFEYSIESFSQNSWYLSNISLDLHQSNKDNIPTEYENKFSGRGVIYYLEARIKRYN